MYHLGLLLSGVLWYISKERERIMVVRRVKTSGEQSLCLDSTIYRRREPVYDIGLCTPSILALVRPRYGHYYD